MMVTRASFDQLRRSGTTVDRVLLSVLAERNRALTAQVVELLFSPVDQRVCRRLLAFAEAVGASASGGWVVLSQSDLATLAGTTRSTVNRALRRAEDAGLVELARGRIRLVDEPALRRRAGTSRAR